MDVKRGTWEYVDSPLDFEKPAPSFYWQQAYMYLKKLQIITTDMLVFFPNQKIHNFQFLFETVFHWLEKELRKGV